MKRWVSSEWKDRKQCMMLRGFPGGASGEEPACRCRRHKASSLPGLGRYPGIGHSSPLQYSCLENPMDRGAWRAPVHGVTLQLQSAANIFLYHLPARFPELLPPHRFPSSWTVLPFPLSLPLPFLNEGLFSHLFLFLFIYFFNLTLKAQPAFS